MSGYDWMGAAACAGMDPDLWFPGAGKNLAGSVAMAVCTSCPVRDQCLEYAVGEALDHGVFGGVTAAERKAMRSGRGVRQPVRPWLLAPHGTDAAYRRHQRHGEVPCYPCQRAAAARHAEGKAAWRAKRAAAAQTASG